MPVCKADHEPRLRELLPVVVRKEATMWDIATMIIVWILLVIGGFIVLGTLMLAFP
jgi:hypothetical protein